MTEHKLDAMQAEDKAKETTHFPQKSMPTVKIRIDYFKPTGKWYAQGEFDMELEKIPGSDTLNTLPVPKRINELRSAGVRPGLVGSKRCEFVWVVRVVYQGEEYAQFLWMPKSLEQAAIEAWRAG